MNRKKAHLFSMICLCAVLIFSQGTTAETVFGQTAQIQVPVNLKAISQGVSSVHLSWEKVKGAKNYQVYRLRGSGGSWKAVKTTSSSSVKFTGLSKNTTYKFKVRALSGVKKSAYSSIVSAKTGVVTKITLNTQSKKMEQGSSYLLKASVTAKAPSKTVQWSADNRQVASVSAAGKVTALKPGTAVITAKAHNGASASAKIQVVGSSSSLPDDENGVQGPAEQEKPVIPSDSAYLERSSKEMLRLVNDFRTANGKKKLSYNKSIQAAADLRAKEALKKPELSHKRYDKNGNLSSFSSVFKDLGLNISYTKTGENLAWRGYQTSPEDAAKALFNQWKNSPGHRANMLDSSYTSMAFGIAYDKTGSGKYQYAAAGVQLFLKQ